MNGVQTIAKATRHGTALILLSALLVLPACAKPPQAQLQASAVRGAAPFTVALANRSTNADEFYWDFGDGKTAAPPKPWKGAAPEPMKHQYTKAGTYTITLKAVKKDPPVTSIATVTVTVDPGPLDHVVIEPEGTTLAVTEERVFKAIAYDRHDNPIPKLAYSFKTAEGAGQVSADGKFTAGKKAALYDKGVTVEVAQGSVTKAATAKVSIVPGPLQKVVLEPNAASLGIGEAQYFSVTAVDTYGNGIRNPQVTWEAAEALGTISDGMLRAKTKAGTFPNGVKVRAKAGDLEAEAAAEVTVKPGPLHSFTLAEVEIAAGESRQLQPAALDGYGNPLSDVAVKWMLGDANAGTLSANGLLAAGEVARSFPAVLEARVSHGGIERIATAGVTIKPAALAQVVIAPDPIQLGMGMTQQFVAVGADKYGNRITGAPVTWSVEGQGGSIDEKGLFTAGTKPGAYDGGVKATLTHAGTSRSTYASVTVEPDRLLFVSNRDGGYDIYVMDVEGRTVQRLTRLQTAYAFTASWSPDGRRIAYDHYDFGSGGLSVFAMGDDGNWTVPLLEEAEYTPNWSRDGMKMVLESIRDGSSTNSTTEIYSVDVDGGNAKRLTYNTASETTPMWSPDGTKIVFASERDGNWEIYVMNADGSSQRRLTTNDAVDHTPVWSPDGKEILFESYRSGQNRLYVMTPGGENVRQVANFESGCADWSADGQKIVLTSNKDAGRMELYVMNRDGTGLKRLTSNEVMDLCPRWAPRKRGLDVSEAIVVIPNARNVKAMTTQEVTAKARAAVVRIETDRGSGSGFIFDVNGLIFTNNHVISDARTISVYLENGTRYTATVRSRDMVHDLAVLKINAKDLPYLELGDVSQVPLGSDVLVIGYPLGGKEVTVTKGLASSIKVDAGRGITWVQTDSAINGGNSGGPMLNMQGQVIGVVSAKLVGGGVENVGFAISVNTLKTCLSTSLVV